MNKKNRFSAPKRLNRSRLCPTGSTGRGYAQPAQPVEEPVDRLSSSGRVPIEEGQKPSLSPSSLLFLVEMFPLLVEVRSRTGRGPIEATVTCHALNAPTVSEPVDS